MRGNPDGPYPAGSSEEGGKFFLGHQCYWKVLVSGWLKLAGRSGKGGENRSQHEGRRERSLGPIECEAEQSCTTGHVKRVGRLENNSSWDRKTLSTCAEMICTRYVWRYAHIVSVQTGVHIGVQSIGHR